MEILEGHHQQWTAQLAGLSGDFRAANTGNLGDARQQLIAPGVVTRQCHYLSVLFYPFRELTPQSSFRAVAHVILAESKVVFHNSINVPELVAENDRSSNNRFGSHFYKAHFDSPCSCGDSSPDGKESREF